MRQLLALALVLLCGVTIGMVSGYFLRDLTAITTPKFFSPLVSKEIIVDKPLEQYSIPALSQREYTPSQIKVIDTISENQTHNYRELLFEFITMGKRMTGQLTLPLATAPTPTKVIIAIRGYVPVETYTTGTGSAPAARVFAEHGYAVLAPDFFGFGGSDPEPLNTWEARFIKPIAVIELIKSIEQMGIADERNGISALQTIQIESVAQDQIGIWAHSNGGQIALTSLEILSEPIPTTLWAPVTVPFPYSILFYSDELSDEGKEQRAWIAMFEQNYDVRNFSLTQHLSRLTGPLQLHHGTNDEAALLTWSDEFVQKIEAENQRREEERQKNETEELVATNAASPTSTPPAILDPISFKYFTYPGADHNLRPVAAWNLAIQRDLDFFAKNGL